MEKQRSFTQIPFLILGALFLLLCMGVLLLGSRLYSTQTKVTNDTNDRRMIVSYVTNQLRRGEGPLKLTSFGDGQAVEIGGGTYDGISYTTCLYVYDGVLCELFTDDLSQAAPDWGDPILPLEEMTFSADGSLLSVFLSFEGGAEEHLRFYAANGVEGGCP